VGKSSLTQRFIRNRFPDEYDPSIEDSFCKQVRIDNYTCVVEVLDTTEEYEYCSPMHSQHMNWFHAFLLVYSITDRRSLDFLHNYIEKIKMVREDRHSPLGILLDILLWIFFMGCVLFFRIFQLCDSVCFALFVLDYSLVVSFLIISISRFIL
jgi:GTPase SAR1 family protein